MTTQNLNEAIAVINGVGLTEEDHEWAKGELSDYREKVAKYALKLQDAKGSQIGAYTAHKRRAQRNVQRFACQLAMEKRAIKAFPKKWVETNGKRILFVNPRLNG